MNTYRERVLALEAEGLCTSDAQAVVDCENLRASLCECGNSVVPGDHRCEECRSVQHAATEQATGVE